MIPQAPSDSSSPVSLAPLPTPGNLSDCAAHSPGIVQPRAFYSCGATSWMPPLQPTSLTSRSPTTLLELGVTLHSYRSLGTFDALLSGTYHPPLTPTPTSTPNPHLACQPSLGPGDLPQGFPCCCTSTISFAPELLEGGAGSEVCSDPSTQLWARLNLVGPQFSCL